VSAEGKSGKLGKIKNDDKTSEGEGEVRELKKQSSFAVGHRRLK
jgi:hypothetical protein